jgi:hypothetical protein
LQDTPFVPQQDLQPTPGTGVEPAAPAKPKSRRGLKALVLLLGLTGSLVGLWIVEDATGSFLVGLAVLLVGLGLTVWLRRKIR